MLNVLILAGGLATRLRPITEKIPKSLVEVCGEPFLAHQLRLLRGQGIERAVLCVGHLGEMVRDFAGDGSAFGMKVDCVFDGPKLLGTAGAIRQALRQVGSGLGNPFFVLYGDSYLPCDFAAVEAAYRREGRLGLMTVYRNEGKWDSSNVVFREGRIVVYDKKNKSPEMHHIDYGLGVLDQRAFGAIPEGEAADLADLYQDLVRRGELAAHEVAQRFYEIGTPDGIAETARYLSEERNPENVVFETVPE